MTVSSLQTAVRPFFQCVAALGRAHAAGIDPDYESVRQELRAHLHQVAEHLRANPGPEEGAARDLTHALAFFVDDVVLSSSLSLVPRWRVEPLAKEEFGQLGGGEKFYHQLDRELAHVDEAKSEPNPARLDRLSVYYTCLGLGFAGEHRGQRSEIMCRINRIREVHPALRDADPPERWCPEALRFPSPARAYAWLPWLPVGVFAVAVAVFLTVLFSFRAATHELGVALGEIHAQGGATAP